VEIIGDLMDNSLEEIVLSEKLTAKANIALKKAQKSLAILQQQLPITAHKAINFPASPQTCQEKT
jgi:hypothetical protein